MSEDTGDTGHIIPVNIEDEMRVAYIDYSMSVIVSRAIPDVRDGFKPVHRRVLYGMYQLGLQSGRAYKKSARIVGEVLGKYHPHGDTSVYDTMVRMAQSWSLRYPLVDGQGNFGSVDGDSPAAMRYTEARLRSITQEIITDINKETVDFQSNFDDSLEEPTVLPARLPNLLLNGSSGIAVGMATNMPPHNLREIAAALLAYIDQEDISVEELMKKYVKAPDFPTGGTIHGYQGVQEAFRTGRGRIVLRGKAVIDVDAKGHTRILVTEIPFMVNKARMVEKTAHLVHDKKIQGISDIRDESGREGMRIVYELKRDAVPQVVLNTLYKHTALQNTFSVNNVALVNGRPQLLNLRDMIRYYVEHRHDVLLRRLNYERKEHEKRMHILKGYLIALEHLDAIISLIRASKDAEGAKSGLIKEYALSGVQAIAILELRLQRLTGLERAKVKKEYEEVVVALEHIADILENRPLQLDELRKEIQEVEKKYGDDRRTEIQYSAEEISIEDVIPNEQVVITFSHAGYVKRTPISAYRTQIRGGVGAKGVNLKQDDFTEHLFAATNHNYLLVFTTQGRLYWLRAFEIPEGKRVAQGRSIRQLLNLSSDDSVRSVLNIEDLRDEDYVNNHYVIMCTTKGRIKKTSLALYANPRRTGIHAIRINTDDTLLNVSLTDGASQIMLASTAGMAIRFDEGLVRPMGRTAAGVRGIRLKKDQKVVGMVCVSAQDAELLVLSEHGYGKRSYIKHFRLTNRGGLGVKTLQVTQKTGQLVAINLVKKEDEFMIMNKSGITIRTTAKQLRVISRATQGVRVVRLNKGDAISAVAMIRRLPEEKAEDGG